jgi:phosphonoacetate hydrolase
VGNSYYDKSTSSAQYMNAASFVRAPTIFEKTRRAGARSALLTCKRKTLELFAEGVDLAMAAEDPPAEFARRYGQPPDIYSRQINHWLWEVAADLLNTRPELKLLYVHTTDYPMHTWAPDEAESREHLQALDERIGQAVEAAPDAAFLLTADHGMRHKTQCWDLARVLEDAGHPVEFVLSPERDYYVVHHRNYTGCAWIWLGEADPPRVREILENLHGVERVIAREETAAEFRLPAGPIGDLTVLGDEHTMFGEMDSAHQCLPDTYRAHGSLHEMDLPLIVYNAEKTPAPESLEANKDLTACLVGD